MSASAKAFIVTDEQLESAGGGASYADIEVPGDYEAVLSSIDDYGTNNSSGWVATFRIEGLPFKYWIPHSEAARWKLIEFVEAFRPGFFNERDERGATAPIDPNTFVGELVGAHVVLDDELDTPRKVIDSVFHHSGEEPSAEDVPVL